MDVRIGTAGWTIPAAARAHFPDTGTQLERYARRFSVVEIDSSFYRSHRVATYERWAASVPAHFRFAVKLPKTITHDRRFVDAHEPLAHFLDETSGLGEKRDVILVQLPPTFAFDAGVVEPFLAHLRAQYGGRIACEPRHASWFAAAADSLLRHLHIARVCADPVPTAVNTTPGGSPDFQYWRLHGSPRVYYSSYEPPQLEAFARAIRAVDRPAWCIFDNTAFGAATPNALMLDDAMR